MRSKNNQWFVKFSGGCSAGKLHEPLNNKNMEVIENKYAEAIQGIKNEWLEGDGFMWFNYVIGLPPQLKNTYLIVILHNQVFNGGFHQYFVNGYGQFAKETIDSLIEIGAKRKAELLKEALFHVNSEQLADNVFREKLLKKKITRLFESDELSDPLDKLDSEYYNSENEDVGQLLMNFLEAPMT